VIVSPDAGGTKRLLYLLYKFNNLCFSPVRVTSIADALNVEFALIHKEVGSFSCSYSYYSVYIAQER